jgi:hypothetical protein
LRLDDTDNINHCANSALSFQRKETVWRCSGILQPMKSTKKIQRENVIHLCDTIIASVPAFEYCLIIDDISSITPTTKK